MWLEDSDHLDRNAIRAGLSEASARPSPRRRQRPARHRAFPLAWLSGWKPRLMA